MIVISVYGGSIKSFMLGCMLKTFFKLFFFCKVLWAYMDIWSKLPILDPMPLLVKILGKDVFGEQEYLPIHNYFSITIEVKIVYIFLDFLPNFILASFFN